MAFTDPTGTGSAASDPMRERAYEAIGKGLHLDAPPGRVRLLRPGADTPLAAYGSKKPNLDILSPQEKAGGATPPTSS